MRSGSAALETTIEVPLGRWEEVGGSKLKLSDMINVPLELLSDSVALQQALVVGQRSG